MSSWEEQEKLLDQIRRTADVIVADADRRDRYDGTMKQRGESILALVDLLKRKWRAK